MPAPPPAPPSVSPSAMPPASLSSHRASGASGAVDGVGHRLVDRFSRHIDYLRLSVIDRCDLRCRYCMPGRQTFLPRSEILTLEELHALALGFIARGVRKLRLTGGEPLVRRDMMDLVRALGRRIGESHAGDAMLEELTLTTNGTRLAHFAEDLHASGVRRVNVSLDTRNRRVFEKIARHDALPQVLEGIAAARAAGLAVKINTVVLKGLNEGELPELIDWAHGQGCDITLIEVMPLGDVGEDRVHHYLPLSSVRAALAQQFTLVPLAWRSSGPARYVEVKETGGRLGFITPLTENFCDGCNRIRVTATGQMFPCLGGHEQIDLRAALRAPDMDAALTQALDTAMRIKPQRHHFVIDRPGGAPALARHMSMTGG